jgi:DNA helicase II / ATP-dependent DNA helicase PcrA
LLKYQKAFRPTPEQRAAASHRRSFSLIEACAGSGKTATIAERFGHLVFGKSPVKRGVLVCAFTREATGELRDRIESRFGPASLTWPHACWTIDELARHLFELLATNGLAGHELRELGGLTSVLDSWRGYAGEVWVGESGFPRYQGPTLGTFKRKGPTVSLKPYPSLTKTYDVSKKRDLLLSGVWTHQDIRLFLLSCLRGKECRQYLQKYITSRWDAFIVDECFDGNAEDVLLWEFMRSSVKSVTAFGDHWQAVFEFRRADVKAVRTWADSKATPDLPAMHLTVSKRHSPEMATLCETARSGTEATILPSWSPGDDVNATPEVVLGRHWANLRLPGVLPDKLGSTFSCTHGILELVYQQVTGRRLGSGDAQLALILGMQVELDETPIFPDLRDCLSFSPDVVTLISSAHTVFLASKVRTKNFKTSYTASVRSAKDTWVPDVNDRFDFAKSVHTSGVSGRIRGLTMHSAKGREWNHVGLAPTADLRERFSRPLNVDDEEDRILFVGLSRARTSVYLFDG